MRSRLRRATHWIYPSHCLLCNALTETSGQLCADCWRETPFLTGLTCDLCATPLPGAEADAVLCDECLADGRVWQRGRAAMAYRDGGRRLVLSLKHGDRLDLVGAAADWMIRAGHDLLLPETVLVPVPVAWPRLIRRRYNQAAELARRIAADRPVTYAGRALMRSRSTPVQDGMTTAERFANVKGAIQPHPRWAGVVTGKHVTLIDDVMTSGATLTAASDALKSAGASQVSVLVLARVEKRP